MSTSEKSRRTRAARGTRPVTATNEQPNRAARELDRQRRRTLAVLVKARELDALCPRSIADDLVDKLDNNQLYDALVALAWSSDAKILEVIEETVLVNHSQISMLRLRERLDEALSAGARLAGDAPNKVNALVDYLAWAIHVRGISTGAIDPATGVAPATGGAS